MNDELFEGAKAAFRMLNQGKWWVPADGKPVEIKRMCDSHRRNAARVLLRHAAGHADVYGIGEAAAVFGDFAPADDTGLMSEAAEQAHEERLADPQAWMRTTPLFLALVDGLGEVAA